MNKALLFAHALIRFQPPSAFPRWRVEKGTRNISPRQINQDIVVLICRIQSGGGGISVLNTKFLLGDIRVQIGFSCPYLGLYSRFLVQ